MNGDPFHKVQTGDKLVIPAQAYNAFIDAARAVRGMGAVGARAMPGVPTPSGLVKVKNTSGGAVGQFGILGIDDILFSPTDNLPGFKNQPVLKGVTPTDDHKGKFVVLAEPLDVNRIGNAVVAGTTLVQINVTDESHTHAEILPDHADVLISSTDGSARILWKESGPGSKWAWVVLHAPPAQVVAYANVTAIKMYKDATVSDWTDYPTDKCYPAFVEALPNQSDGGMFSSPEDPSLRIFIQQYNAVPPQGLVTSIGSTLAYVPADGNLWVPDPFTGVKMDGIAIGFGLWMDWVRFPERCAMSWSQITDHCVQCLDLVNEYIDAYNERVAVCWGTHTMDHVNDGDNLQKVYGTLHTLQINVLNQISGTFLRTFDDDGTAISDDFEGQDAITPQNGNWQPENWSSDTLTQYLSGGQAPQYSTGARRYTTHPCEGGTPLWGYIQDGDIVGPWLFEDLQKAFNAMTCVCQINGTQNTRVGYFNQAVSTPSQSITPNYYPVWEMPGQCPAAKADYQAASRCSFYTDPGYYGPFCSYAWCAWTYQYQNNNAVYLQGRRAVTKYLLQLSGPNGYYCNRPDLIAKVKLYLSVENRPGYVTVPAYQFDAQGDPVPAQDGKYHVIDQQVVPAVPNPGLSFPGYDLGWPFPNTIDDRPPNEPNCFDPDAPDTNVAYPSKGWKEQSRMVVADWGVPGGFTFVAE